MSAETAVASPVTVRVARSEEDRARVFALRARVRPDGAAAVADAYDRQSNATLLLAESRFDGEALGTLRILAGEEGPMMIDGLLTLPASMRRQSIAEGSRLVVRECRDAALVRRMLWKAFHRYCLAAQVQTMLVAARDDAAREYAALGFTDVFPDAPLFALRGRDVATHRLLRLGVFEAHEALLRSDHPLRGFFFVERHPEIDLFGTADRAHPGKAMPRIASDRLRAMAALAELAIV